MLESFGDRLPAVLHQLRGVSFVHAAGDHLVEAEQGASLQHAAENRLLAHQVRFDFGDEGRFEHAGAMAAGRRGISLGDFKPFAARIVFRMHRDQGRHAEAAPIFLAHFGAGTFRRDHDHRDVGPNLHAFLDNVETMRVGETGVFLHQRHDLFDHRSMLLVGRKIQHQVGAGYQFFERPGNKAVAGCVFPGSALFGDGVRPQGVGDIQPAVAHVQPLVQTLGATADNHDFLAPELAHAIAELRTVHESALAKLFQLKTQGQGIEVVHEIIPDSIGGVDSAKEAR